MPYLEMETDCRPYDIQRWELMAVLTIHRDGNRWQAIRYKEMGTDGRRYNILRCQQMVGDTIYIDEY